MDTPYSVTVLEAVSSTQDAARSAFVPGRPAVVVARSQSAGRGRGGARWETAPAAVAVSVAFQPDWDPPRMPLLTLVAGVAASRALGEAVSLKWPNDLLVGDAKVAGILVEVAAGVTVAGLGVNLWWPHPPPGWAGLRADSPGEEEGPGLALAWVDQLLELAAVGPDAWPRSEYRQRCTTLGSEVTWEGGGPGRAVDIGADGSLVVDVPGEGATVLAAGAIRHLRPA